MIKQICVEGWECFVLNKKPKRLIVSISRASPQEPFAFLKWIQYAPHGCMSLQPDCCAFWLMEVNNNDSTVVLSHGDHVLIILFTKFQIKTIATSNILWNPPASLLSLCVRTHTYAHTHSQSHCSLHWCALAAVFIVVSSFCCMHMFWTIETDAFPFF